MAQFGGMPFKPRGTSEIVYNIPIPQANELSVWVYSTIHHKSGKSRKTGSDAIRTIMLYQGKGVMKEPKTLRTANWARNVEKKVKTLLSYATEYRCPWGHPLVIRHRKENSGTFYGCAFFPECQYIYRGKKPPSAIYDPANMQSLPGSSSPEKLTQRALDRLHRPKEDSSDETIRLAWKVEHAKSSRSTCEGCNEKIAKGEVRIGKPRLFQEHLSHKWYHSDCARRERFELDPVEGLEGLTDDEKRKLAEFGLLNGMAGIQFCTNCGNTLNLTAKFCSRCGIPVQKY